MKCVNCNQEIDAGIDGQGRYLFHVDTGERECNTERPVATAPPDPWCGCSDPDYCRRSAGRPAAEMRRIYGP